FRAGAPQHDPPHRPQGREGAAPVWGEHPDAASRSGLARPPSPPLMVHAKGKRVVMPRTGASPTRAWAIEARHGKRSRAGAEGQRQAVLYASGPSTFRAHFGAISAGFPARFLIGLAPLVGSLSHCT